MQTFIEQKLEVRKQIVDLENENRLLERQVEDAEEAMSKNRQTITKLYETIRSIGTTNCSECETDKG